MRPDLPGSAERLSVLIRVAQRLTAERDLDRLLDLIIDSATAVTQADRGSLYLIDTGAGEIVSRVAQSVDEIRMPIGTGIAGHVAETGDVINLMDAYVHPEFNPELDALHGYRTTSMLCVPMENTKGERIGVVQVMNKRGEDGTEPYFDAQDEALLGAFASQAAIAVDNARHIEAHRRLLESVLETLQTTIDYRDYITGGHTARVTDYSLRVAKTLGETDTIRLRSLRYAGMLHDYGKVGVREAVLCKAGNLTDEEYEHMKNHVVLTKKIVSKLDFPPELDEVPSIAAQHHERLDGSGYPDGLRGEAITWGGRILAVCDVFDALSSHRQYKEPWPPEKILAMLVGGSGPHFDSAVVRALLACMPGITRDYGPEGKGHFVEEYAKRLLAEVEQLRRSG